MIQSPDAILLFSGGLDSILAAKVLQQQGLSVQCAHFVTPFFGDREKVARWSKIYNLDIMVVDAGREFCAMLARGPEHGYGQTLNPCVDCKILLLSLAKKLLPELGAKFLATGEVLGQRPMSQRRDSLDLIQNAAGVKGLLVRPLCALHLEPAEVENSGLVDRSRLLALNGRGRNGQLALAREFGLQEIPTPAGGCVLTERENGRRYWQVIKKWRNCHADTQRLEHDFRLARLGRQFWRKDTCEWLQIGRNAADNEALRAAAGQNDVTLKLLGMSGPLGLARDGRLWSDNILAEAAAVLAAHSSRAAGSHDPVEVSCRGGKNGVFSIRPDRLEQIWSVPAWEDAREEIRAYNRQITGQRHRK